MTQIASILSQITINMPLFSNVFYFGNWGFILVAIVALFRESCVRVHNQDDEVYWCWSFMVLHSSSYRYKTDKTGHLFLLACRMIMALMVKIMNWTVCSHSVLMLLCVCFGIGVVRNVWVNGMLCAERCLVQLQLDRCVVLIPCLHSLMSMTNLSSSFTEIM